MNKVECEETGPTASGSYYERDWRSYIVAEWSDEQLSTTDPEWIEHAPVEIFNRAVDEAA